MAGFLDSDGCVFLQWSKDCARPQLAINWSQKTSHDKVLCLIQDVVGGSLRENIINGESYSMLTVCGNNARMTLDRIRQHLVIKRHYAEVCMKMANQPCEDREKARQWLKWQRRINTSPVPNFPSRKWLAGYLDGDGCFSVSKIGHQGGAAIILHVACSKFDSAGILTLQKNFGGRIHDMCEGRVNQYVLSLTPSKAVQLLEYCAADMIVKQYQAMFILGCARMGHYRDGKRIREILKQLKAHPQRLNETELDVGLLVRQVQDQPRPWNKKGLTACVNCGRNDRTHVGFGLCATCFRDEGLRRKHATKLQSEYP